jgi:DNA repair protein RadC
MSESLKLCDIDLVDHVVVGAHRFYSMREKGLI